MLNFSVTPLNVVLAVAVSYGVLTLATKETPKEVTVQGRVVTLTGAVSEDSSKQLVKALEELRNDGTPSVLLDIDSPGGDVLAGREVISLMNRGELVVNTFSDNYFMSMGMSFFLEGKKRIITPDSLGMIHRGSVGPVSYFGLTKMIEQADLQLVQLNAVGGDTTEVEQALERLHSMKDAMDKFMEKDIATLEKIKQTAPNPKKTQEIIDSLKKGNRDIFLNAKDLLDSGIATHIVNNKKEAAAL